MDKIRQAIRFIYSKFSQTKISEVMNIKNDYLNTDFIDILKYNNESTEGKVKIMSFNVLADMFCSQSNYRTKPFYHLDFMNRFRKIKEIIKYLDADIVCLQELDRFDSYYKVAFIDMGYEYFYQQKQGRDEGIAILWKKDQFELLNQQVYDFKDHIPQRIMEAFPSFCNQYSQRHVQIIIKVRLRNMKDQKIMNIYNSHFFWNPHYETIKVLQSMILQHIVHNEIESKNDLIFVSGDLNSHPDSNVISILTQSLHNEYEVKVNNNNVQFLQKYHIEFIKELVEQFRKYYQQQGLNLKKMKFKSSYQDYRLDNKKGKNELKHPKFTNYTERFKGTLDYIFYKDFQENNVKVVRLLNIPKASCLGNGCPNHIFPSDHLPIVAEFDYK